MNIADEIGSQWRSRPDAVAIHLPHRTITFRQLDAMVRKMAGALTRQNVGAGDVVALSCANELALLIAMLAVAKIGATAFSIPQSMPASLKAEMAAKAGVGIVACDHPTANIAGLPRLAINIDALATDDAFPDNFPGAGAPKAPWLIISGSGSTGNPKLFAVTHAQFLARMRRAGEMLELSPDDRFASLVHLDFTSPKERCLAALLAGASVVLFNRRRLDPFAACKKHGVTVLDATVFHIEQLLSNMPSTSRLPLLSLRVLQLSASTVSDGLRQRITATLTPALHVRYGTNETGPISVARPHQVMQTPGGVGFPPADVRIEIVDAQGQALPNRTVGQIRVRSPGMVSHYLDDDQGTQKAFRDGWFYPGDLGKLAPDGQLIFCGRADNLMIMNGINIYPAEIERVISQHPAVGDVTVVALNSPVHQNVPVCAVVLQDGRKVDERTLRNYASGRLGAHAPRRIVVLDRIPRTETGKPVRSLLIQEISEKLGSVASRTIVSPTAHAGPFAPAQLKMRQTARSFEFKCQFDLPADTKTIDEWLETALDIRVTPANVLTEKLGARIEDQRVAMAWRILLLTRELMQASRIPVFDPGCLIGIYPAPAARSSWITSATVPFIDHISEKSLTIACDGAVSILHWLIGKPCTPDSTAALHDFIQKDILPPLHRLFSSGKSTIHVLRAAHARDIPFIHLGAGVYQLGWGSRIRRIDRSTTDRDSAIGSKLVQNKMLSANLLRLAGLPAPQHAAVATDGEALEAARTLGWPLVVKPIDRDRGEGVTVDIRGREQLLAALKVAKGSSRTRKVIVERAIDGVCHRLFITKGRLLYAVKRLPKSVHGDGAKTVAALIEAANQQENFLPPWRRTERYPDDTLAVEAMAAAGFSLDSVPAQGERVPLRNIESTGWGGYDEDVTRGIHPDNLDIAIRAAALFDLEVAGIDIITPDISRPWHENGAIINEVNFAPLFGGGEISRSHAAEFLARLIAGDGRIPVEIFLGNDAAFQLALDRQKELIADNITCYLTTHTMTLTPSGAELTLPFDSLHRRGKALLMNQQVEAVIFVVQTDELLQAGLPTDRIDRLTIAGNSLLQGKMQNAFERLQQFIGHHLKPFTRA